jgi:hypothetical protein
MLLALKCGLCRCPGFKVCAQQVSKGETATFVMSSFNQSGPPAETRIAAI